jgi:2-hydroxy-3-keto-5-methylthiopentenyl-1-phosphate phosphatase
MSDKIAVVCDFDGTITIRDIGHHFFESFVPDKASWEELLGKWKLGLISSRECLEQEVASISATRNDLDEFIENEKFDPYFKDFVDFSNRRKYDFLILSDGMDYYIEAMLMRYGFGYLEFRANHLVFGSGEKIESVEFPFYGLSNSCTMCGDCKRFHLEQLKENGFYTVYIGNGYSDRCASEHADLVFAKDDLLTHMKQKGLDHVEFRNFRDIERSLTEKFYISGQE